MEEVTIGDSTLSIPNETEFFNNFMVYQDDMKPSDVGLAGNIVMIGYKLLEEQCPSCRKALSNQMRVLYGNLPKYYQNHEQKRSRLFNFVDPKFNSIEIRLGETLIGTIIR